MSTVGGHIHGASNAERAIRLAGALAELSQTRLILRLSGAEVELSARITNLPAALLDEVARTGEAHLSAPAIGANFQLSGSTGSWACSDVQTADELRRRLGP